ncbi:bidirectional sugar transporter SWEET7-like [Impatiens glandulifera]|uniref:bidirectional sugar transporter SWEET7-like n=1 Tax=Impatiens glandulifera TaxID=253017 RepID=UPI001FB160D7|nr:bidirectional sugar transporter SWEET7-like [Impatiens glandulifera]
MFSLVHLRFAVGVLGNIISLALFLSPVPTFLKIYKKKTVEQYSPVPYIATIGNCALWVLYGLPDVTPGSTLVISINGAGFVIQLVYLLVFICYSDKKRRVRMVAVIMVELVLVATLAVLVLNLVHTRKLRSRIIGIICIFGNVCMYASPLSVMRMVVSTKSVEYMPFSLSLAAFANAVCWTTYALIKFDPNIVVPNGLGMLFALAQLILYGAYYKSSKRLQLEEKNAEMNEISGGFKNVAHNNNKLPV